MVLFWDRIAFIAFMEASLLWSHGERCTWWKERCPEAHGHRCVLSAKAHPLSDCCIGGVVGRSVMKPMGVPPLANW